MKIFSLKTTMRIEEHFQQVVDTVDGIKGILTIGQPLQVLGCICHAFERQFFNQFLMGSFLVMNQCGPWRYMVLERLIAAPLRWLAIPFNKANGLYLICCNTNTNLIT